MHCHRAITCVVSASFSVLLGTLLTACITHEARIIMPSETASLTDDGKVDSSKVEGSTVIAEVTYPTPPGPPRETVQRGPLPQDVSVTAWRSDQDGVISRGNETLKTPLPWWQRFPCDMITDLAPTDLVVRAERTVVISAVVPRTRAQLDVEAAAAGYATTSAAATPNSSSTTSSTPLPQANP